MSLGVVWLAKKIGIISGPGLLDQRATTGRLIRRGPGNRPSARPWLAARHGIRLPPLFRLASGQRSHSPRQHAGGILLHADPGSVHNAIDPTELRQDKIRKGCERGFVPNVQQGPLRSAHATCDPFIGLVSASFADIGPDNAPTPGDTLSGDRRTDSLCPSGYDDRLA